MSSAESRGTDWSDEERRLLTETMRKAGFPVCPTEKAVKEQPNLVRLPECVQK